MPKLQHGVGAKCTVLTLFVGLHPSDIINSKHFTLDEVRYTTVVLGDFGVKESSWEVTGVLHFQIEPFF